MSRTARKIRIKIDQARVNFLSKYRNIFSWLVFKKLKIAEPIFSSGINIEAKIYFDKKNKSYFIQSTKYSEIYTAANTLEDLAKRFHDVVHYYFEIHRYATQRTKFVMDFSELAEQLHKEGFVNVRKRFCLA